MLLKECMEITRFSDGERPIVQLLLNEPERIRHMSLKEIAKEAYSSPSVCVRIAKKLGFSGWNALKETYLKEVEYLITHFQSIDANIPFTETDKEMNIAAKIAEVYRESVADTFSLIEHDSLQKAVRLLENSKGIHIFCISNLNYAAEEFVFKMKRINIPVYLNYTQGCIYHEAAMTPSDHCAICISYSGETPSLLQTVSYLQANHVPILGITSVGTNSLSSIADVVLHISTREKMYSKIGGFSSLTSISLILDILYSCMFNLHYDRNLQYKTDIARLVEVKRRVDNEIIREQKKDQENGS